MGEQPPKKVKLDPKDFMFSNLKGQVLVKKQGSINGQSFIIEDLTDCEVHVLDYTGQVTIDYCTNCRIFLGPCDGSVFIRNCNGCTVTLATKQVWT